jgi:hypothetical protein
VIELHAEAVHCGVAFASVPPELIDEAVAAQCVELVAYAGQSFHVAGRAEGVALRDLAIAEVHHIDRGIFILKAGNGVFVQVGKAAHFQQFRR